jgi:beta-barrel assembly-enhancing protease
MTYNFFRKKAVIAAAVVLCSTATALILPAPTADASILSAVIGSGIQYVQVSKQLNYYNGDGRDKFFEELKKKYGVNEDPTLNERVNRIMGNLSNGIAAVDLSITKKPYNYFINNETTFNAFCSLGHNLSINTGLFDLLTNEDEIAVVLGHEMGHGQKDHPVKGFKNAIPYDLIAQIYSESQGGSSGGTLAASVFANYATATQVTKPQEWEADNLAFTYITAAGYNPGACAAVWQRIMEKQGDSSANFVGEIFSPSDHPTNEQRRENYAKKLTEYSNGKVTVSNNVVKINGKDFATIGAISSMSSQERTYFAAGNLAAAYHNGYNTSNAYVGANNVVYLGDQAIMQAQSTDADAQELASCLNAIK